MTDIVDRLREFGYHAASIFFPPITDTCNEAADTIEALRLADKGRRAEVAMLKDEAIALRAQVAGLQKDAARYLYLRDVAWDTGSLVFYAERYGPEDWDEHIDAAMSAATPSQNTVSTSAGPATAGD